jgi:Zn finger protein HypA/HybF involved in hydrogenase expression
MQTFPGQRGAMCPNCGHEEAIMAQGKVAEVSMPPEGTVPQKETALPYNPGAYEGEVEAMHPAAQYTYQRAVAQGAAPQAAMAAAQEKQGEMMKRTQEGQNTQGVQIPVISRIGAEEEKCKDCGKPMNPVEAMVSSTHGVCGDCTKRKQKEVTGFVSVATIKRVSHLI